MEFEEFFERMRRRVRELFEEIESEFETMRSMWGISGELEPLSSINAYPDHYEVYVDLPYSDLDSLSIEVRGHKLVIECRLKNELEFNRWYRYRGIKFRKYYTELTLPPDSDVSNIKIERNEIRKLIRIIIPRKKT
ncbi:MAG: hypothetical protein B6U89_05325 [Desulfurococcales archaeon ex4484_58]|nr:MAG: hypothetical protein B6U89_05325 [Desulfurococcales archaeon ex4484_58]